MRSGVLFSLTVISSIYWILHHILFICGLCRLPYLTGTLRLSVFRCCRPDLADAYPAMGHLKASSAMNMTKAASPIAFGAALLLGSALCATAHATPIACTSTIVLPGGNGFKADTALTT